MLRRSPRTFDMSRQWEAISLDVVFVRGVVVEHRMKASCGWFDTDFRGQTNEA
ncbi:hypothetical protein Q9K01_00030 [Qipengyuania sp. DY56-A-20]|uniref:Transposase n=1 Tax=Qipengyuania benthica TaxID=3067651 RepID=A0ABT9H403_9SPHN|nr:hypothetical protein [Qipengyuania sp. DY56-A-20]MDP4538012.1 hypothetical protein [Qipengyuania sp. DY56-A-20]